ncbi:hypothetical protein R3W88_027245 [Solanum pinnatisectum]|uniref:Uncharacterized protein n=1 Tax=Solanum pinnatisectum TaxID=50273 RepID=A0AAV9LFG8_9SOLN|nr:hypothetical protein R3W88_027245 [Solanum pinnatisectum]
MENPLEYPNITSSNIHTKIDTKYITTSPFSSFSPLTIQFNIHTHEQHWFYNRNNTKSLCLKLNPSEYMSHDMFYNVMQRNLDNIDEEYFDNNRRDRVIQDIIRKIRIVIANTSKKELREFEIVVDVTLDIDKVSREILLPEESRRFNGMVPVSHQSSMKNVRMMIA